MLVALYSIPKITLYPILLLAFGLGMPAKIAFGAIHGIIPIALFTLNAVRNIKPVLLKTGARDAARALADGALACCFRPRCRRSSPASASASRSR